MNLSSMLDGGQPLTLEVNLIDEDPNQPRTSFDESTLAELSNSIKERGVKTPISVRENPENSERYIINHGARRLRATKILGLDTIPALIDNDYLLTDQIVENIQREDLSSHELAKVVDRLEKSGFKKSDIATQLGKSNAWVSQYSRLNKLPEPIALAFESGKIKDVTVANELAKLFDSNPNDVLEVLSNEVEIGRGDVKNLKAYLNNETETVLVNDESTEKYTIADQDSPPKINEPKVTDPNKFKNPRLKATYQGQLVTVNVKKRPSDFDLIWVKFDDNGAEEEAVIENVKLSMLMESE